MAGTGLNPSLTRSQPPRKPLGQDHVSFPLTNLPTFAHNPHVAEYTTRPPLIRIANQMGYVAKIAGNDVSNNPFNTNAPGLEAHRSWAEG